MSAQEVNLLPPDMAPSIEWLGARELLLGASLFAFLLLTYSGLQALNLPALKSIEESVRNQLNAMNAAAIAPQSNTELNTAIGELQAAMAHQNDVLTALEGESQHTFSAYLRGLSQSRIDGLWLEKIQVQRAEGLTEIGLTGRSLTTPLLPELLLTLSEHEVYSSYQFTNLRVNRDGGTIKFSLDTVRAEPAT